MGAKLVNQSGHIPIFSMTAGQIGEIVRWDGNTSFIGRLVIMCHDSTVQLLSQGGYWTEETRNEPCRVRILQPGEQIEIT